MKTDMQTTQHDIIKDDIDAGEETSKTALIIGIIMAAMVGIWGMACLIGGLSGTGMGGLMMGYITAIFGG